MGIKSLMKLLNEESPGAIKDTKLKNYTGKKIAIDASTQLYQYFVMIQVSGEDGFNQMLESESGQVTSHIQGFFNRTIKLMESGIKPVYVFDGKPPELKSSELKKRKKLKDKASQEIKDLLETEHKFETNLGTIQEDLTKTGKNIVEEVNKLNKRTVRVTKEHNEQVKKLLRLMGVPVIEAPGEAEAQCASLCEKGIVHATGTEDMDALTFGTPIMIKNLTFSAGKKRPVQEINFKKILTELDLTKESFIDMCILCGCDYGPSIKGIGPKKAYGLIKKHLNLENVFKHVRENTRYEVPDELSDNLDSIRELFKNPDVLEESVKISFKKPDTQGLIDYLVTELNFDIDRVNKSVDRLKKAIKVSSQTSIDSFFKVKKVEKL
jgi:flap endonuclease-1